MTMSMEEVQGLQDGLFAIAGALQRLGTGDACTEGWGAIEHLAQMVKEGNEAVAESIGELAASVRESTDLLLKAMSVREKRMEAKEVVAARQRERHEA